jgi:hypothetical protein
VRGGSSWRPLKIIPLLRPLSDPRTELKKVDKYHNQLSVVIFQVFRTPSKERPRSVSLSLILVCVFLPTPWPCPTLWDPTLRVMSLPWLAPALGRTPLRVLGCRNASCPSLLWKFPPLISRNYQSLYRLVEVQSAGMCNQQSRF